MKYAIFGPSDWRQQKNIWKTDHHNRELSPTLKNAIADIKLKSFYFLLGIRRQLFNSGDPWVASFFSSRDSQSLISLVLRSIGWFLSPLLMLPSANNSPSFTCLAAGKFKCTVVCGKQWKQQPYILWSVGLCVCACGLGAQPWSVCQGLTKESLVSGAFYIFCSLFAECLCHDFSCETSLIKSCSSSCN